MTEPVHQYEVRAIRAGEEELFLKHMCTCFNLELDSARPIFFADPYFDITHKRILIDNSSGSIISGLTIIPTAVRVTGGALIPVAGIAGVCTTPEHRGQGYAQMLIRSTQQAAASEFGYVAAALSTDRPEIYRKLGFEHCSSVTHWTAHRNLLPPFPEASSAANSLLHDSHRLIAEIKALYEYARASQPGIFLRDDHRWQIIESRKPDDHVITWRDGIRLEGCVIYRTREHRGDRVMDILDLIASTAAARRGLMGYIQRLEDIDLVTGQMRSSDVRKLGIQDIPRFTSYRREGVMMSILDFDACLSLVAQTGIMTPVVRRSESGLTIRLENALSTKDRKPLRLFSVSTDRLGVAIGMAPADEMTGDWISVDVGAMAQLYFGYTRASKLRSQDRLWISSENALAIAEALFPPYDTFMSQLDAF